MFRIQAMLLLCCLGLLAAGEVVSAPVGEAGLKAIEAARAEVTLVSGVATKTVRRMDPPDAEGDAQRVAFAVDAKGRYDITLTDPTDPDGERTRFVSDGTRACSMQQASKEDKPQVKFRAAGERDILNRLLSCLSMNLVDLRKDYTVELKAADNKERELKLIPKDKALAAEFTAASVFIDATNKPIRVILDETNGNRQRLVVSTFTDNPKADPLWFVLPPVKK
ncbi:MAG: hypothetical protein AAB263_05190 [Planctomycetota bacterium]